MARRRALRYSRRIQRVFRRDSVSVGRAQRGPSEFREPLPRTYALIAPARLVRRSAALPMRLTPVRRTVVSISRRPTPARFIPPPSLRSSFLSRPSESKRGSPCVARRTRQQVMFARQIAGRSWGSRGGPSPPRKRSLFSNYSCR